ncbi:hypothetical protein ACFP3P_16605 [Pelomonas aquatica]|jgi:hypothetical protein
MATQTTTVRLPELLKSEAESFAASLGISLNALMAVALRDYLDGRTGSASRPSPASSVPSPVTESAPVAKPATQAQTYRAPRSRSDPCPCGARNGDGHPLRWKQCHGKP